MSTRMALEEVGKSLNVEKLKRKLKERYPDYNFDISPEPDTKHKSHHDCMSNKIFYTDTQGNKYCGARYKEVSEDNLYKWEYKVCHALVQKAKQGGEQDEIPF